MFRSICLTCFSIRQVWWGHHDPKRKILLMPLILQEAGIRYPSGTMILLAERISNVMSKSLESFAKEWVSLRLPLDLLKMRIGIYISLPDFKVIPFFKVFAIDMRDYGYDPVFTDGHFLENGSDLIGKALADFISANFRLSKHRGA
jgi:hypothetical protein